MEKSAFLDKNFFMVIVIILIIIVIILATIVVDARIVLFRNLQETKTNTEKTQ